MGRGAFRGKRNARRKKRGIYPYGGCLIRQDLEPILYKMFTQNFPLHKMFIPDKHGDAVAFGDENGPFLMGHRTPKGVYVGTAIGTGGEERRPD